MKVFIDTSAFVSLLVENEESRTKVVEKYNHYKQQRATFFTSYYILDELLARLLDLHLSNIGGFTKTIMTVAENNELITLNIDNGVFQKSYETFIKYADHHLSFTDATTFISYKELNLDEIFTIDSNFKRIHAITQY